MKITIKKMKIINNVENNLNKNNYNTGGGVSGSGGVSF